ncbi:GNAT family N-acetyltransferase [Sphingomonas sp. BK235]|uniref:GNAT family N-acetyltransferase n=1 Tax=Sphingomonas sp. BK235 TaxID=2512131 RepID=UPI001042AC07|nr:GNAT family N-acetyltransferase [Sphingomonas sp. BK235]TCP37368.1 ribosomal protein S18 acetylase RimI-like enzyme [Sphingomonas sp. BK235]
MTAPPWRLRRAGAEDSDALALVAGATFLEAFAGVLDGADIVAHVARNSSADAFARYLAAGATATLAETEQGGAPIGYTLLTAPDLPIAPQPGDVELKRIYTLAPFYGSGLGAALIARALADARAAGAGRVLLGVYGGNHRAHRFYEKHGFAVAGERRFLVGATWHDDRVYAHPL